MKTTLYMILVAVMATACVNKAKSGSNDTATEEKSITVEKAETNSKALNDYMKLKDVLVQTDAQAAKTAGDELSTSLSDESFDASLIEAANLIAASDDVEQQRAAFKTITDGLIESLKSNGEEIGVFVQYCPMAFGNTGASWLSMSNEIRNPYFGDKMLKCGRVAEEL